MLQGCQAPALPLGLSPAPLCPLTSGWGQPKCNAKQCSTAFPPCSSALYPVLNYPRATQDGWNAGDFVSGWDDSPVIPVDTTGHHFCIALGNLERSEAPCP